jgi:hypothetical protein
VRGAARSNRYGHHLSPRIAVSFERRQFERLTFAAKQLGMPVSEFIRQAVDRALSTWPAAKDR